MGCQIFIDMGLCSRASGNQESRCRTIQSQSEISSLPVFDFEAHPANTDFLYPVNNCCNIQDNNLLINVSFVCLLQHNFILKNASFVLETVLPLVKKKLKVGISKQVALWCMAWTEQLPYREAYKYGLS